MADTLLNVWNIASNWIIEHGIVILVILGIAIPLQLIGKRLIAKSISKAVAIDSLLPTETGIEAKRQETLIRIFSGLFTIVLWVVVLMMVISEIGIAIGPMLAAAGVAGLAVGFGGQYLIHDLVTGTFIILENQYRVGDLICIDTVCGEVEDISLRKTTLRDIDGVVHHIPHGEVKVVANRSKSYSKASIELGISYDEDVERAAAVIDRVGQEMTRDPEWKELLIDPPAFLRIEDFADSAVVLKIMGATRPGEQFRVAGELRKRLKAAFDDEGIEIPFPQRVIHQAKD
ncbi:putative MscS family protein YkuT [bacterium BMS3Abin01]|nr:putative MscS family protein YkuT [bacterium BMS3Abin01]HDZ59607.1 mechanosensitive ion channel family protein [Actinomycetota bacterium]